MNSPYPPYGPSGGQPQYPQQPYAQQPYPQQQYPAQQPYPDPRYSPQPGGYPPQNHSPGYPPQQYPYGAAPAAPLPAYIAGAILCAGAVIMTVLTGFEIVALPGNLVIVVGGVLFLLRVRAAPIVAIVGGVLELLLITLVFVAMLASGDNGAQITWQMIVWPVYSTLVIVLGLLPPVRSAVRPAAPPYQRY